MPYLTKVESTHSGVLEEPSTISTAPAAPVAPSTSRTKTDRRIASDSPGSSSSTVSEEESATTLHEGEPASSATVIEKKEGKEGDLEKGVSEEKERYYSKENGSEIIVVEWKGRDDPANPLNWSNARRMTSTFMFVPSLLLRSFNSELISTLP